MPSYKPVKATGQVPDDYPDVFLDCRVDRHSWVRPHIIDPNHAVPFGYGVYRECWKCHAMWIRSYNRTLTAKIYERRVYPPGYLMRGFRSQQIQYVRLMIEREGTAFINPDNYLSE